MNRLRTFVIFLVVFPAVFIACTDRDPLFDPDSDEKSITEFKIRAYLIDADINEDNLEVTFTVPAKVDLHHLLPTITISPGASISPPSKQYVDLSHPFSYLVTAENGSSVDYHVLSTQVTDTVLLIIDVQNGWAFRTYQCDSVFANINLLAGRARKAGIPVIYVYDYSENENYHTGWDMEIVEAVKPKEGDQIIGKQDMTNILESAKVDQALTEEHAGTLVLCGMTSGACVNSTCVGALQKGYGVIVATDCHSALDDDPHYNAKNYMNDLNERWAELGADTMKARNIYF